METDMRLLRAVRMMEPEALATIFDLYAPGLYRYALYRHCDPATADTIVGDVFARLLDQLSSGKGPYQNLRSYLFQSAYHLLVDESRYSNRRAALEVVDRLRQDEPSTAVWVENRLFLKKVWVATQTVLSADQRHVIILRFLEGLSLRETAAVLGKKASQVKVIQHRAIANLRKALLSVEMDT